MFQCLIWRREESANFIISKQHSVFVSSADTKFLHIAYCKLHNTHPVQYTSGVIVQSVINKCGSFYVGE